VFEIGNSLREARSRRAVDINQAEVATKIRAKYLRALEDERFEQLPSQTYVKGFLRTYADYLGLDGQLYVDEFNSRFVAGVSSDPRPRRSSVRPERRTRKIETSVVLLAVAVVSIVTLVVISAWQTSGSGVPTTTTTQHKRKPRVRIPVAPKLTAYLQIEAVNGASYVSVHRSSPTGRLLFQGTIEKGRTEPFKGKYFWLSLSAPENLRITAGGKQVAVGGLKPVTLIVNPSGVHPD
jgi:cytoskeleton protein RodZ